jgi:transposase
MHTHQNSSEAVATIGVDIGKNTFHLVGLDQRGAIVLRIKVSRSQLERRLANVPRCLVGLEAGCGSHHIARQIRALGHDVRLIPAQYVKAFLKGHKNDYRDAEAIAEAVQRPTMNFVAIKTPEQSDLLSLHRVRSRLVGQRTAVINQIRGFLIERGITVRQAASRGDARSVAVDRTSRQAPRPSQSAGDRPRQQARPHRLGGACPRS